MAEGRNGGMVFYYIPIFFAIFMVHANNADDANDANDSNGF
jgi:hypothetical protein